jgi:hypothetical protein
MADTKDPFAPEINAGTDISVKDVVPGTPIDEVYPDVTIGTPDPNAVPLADRTQED